MLFRAFSCVFDAWQLRMKRVLVPNLLRRFVTEEQESIAKQKTERKTFKQFMLMHGTRWAP